jgi:tRNA (mo5U34)-methyltransferase
MNDGGEVSLAHRSAPNLSLAERVAARTWFHTIDLGGGVVTPGVDKSPDKLPALGIPSDLTGKSVIDIGAWDGFFSFECERRGAARVLATDGICWTEENMADGGGFRLAHEALESRVEALTARVEDLAAAEIGQFDLVLFLGVLYHAPDPLGYLRTVRKVCKGTAIIETHVDLLDIDRPALAYYPSSYLNGDGSNFFGPNEAAVIGMCLDAGFQSCEVVNRHYMQNRMVFHAHVSR